MGSKSDVSAFFRLRFRNGLGTKPAGALLFRMRSRRSFLRLCLVAEVSLCLVAEVSQWLGHDSIVFRGSKSNVSRFLRLQFRNGLDAKPAGSFFLFNGFQKRCFGIFPAAVSQWLVRVARALFLCFFFVFCLFLVGSKSDVSAFFRLRFRNGLGTKPAGALPFRMRSRRSFLRLYLVAEVSLCLVAEVLQWLGHALFLVGSKNNVSVLFWLRFCMVWALYFFLFWALYFFLFSGFQKRRFGFAMARAQNLLGFCFFACASQTPFS